MDKTRIEWADASWNPVTGCLHGCTYCYARRIAKRFDGGCGTGGLHERNRPFRKQRRDDVTDELVIGKKEPYPYGFEPTLHRYRLDIPMHWKKPSTVFVCSMADLFGDWVPPSWIFEVFQACLAAPQHRYLFLTKNFLRYLELDICKILPHRENFWFGTSVTSNRSIPFPGGVIPDVHTFWSIEPMLGPVTMLEVNGLPEWVILGAETGNRKGKVVPKLEWIDHIVQFCDAHGVPVFMKDSLIPVVGEENMRRDFPWKR